MVWETRHQHVGAPVKTQLGELPELRRAVGVTVQPDHRPVGRKPMRQQKSTAQRVDIVTVACLQCGCPLQGFGVAFGRVGVRN